MDFNQYRQQFYFFQYAFACRSNLIYDPYNATLMVMRELLADTSFHWRHEFKPAKEVNIRKRKPASSSSSQPSDPLPLSRPTPRQMHKLRKMFNVNTDGINRPWGPTLYTATDEGQYRHLMLYEGEYLKWGNGRNWNDFHNLYRALLIYDLYQTGETDESIFRKYSEYMLDEVTEQLGILENMPVAIQSSTTLQQDLIKHICHPVRSEVERLILMQCREKDVALICWPEKLSKLDNDTALQTAYRQKIRTHYKRALQLIQLAESFTFKTFPSVLLPL